MNTKHRVSVIFAMLSLTMTMLFFQNCSPSGGLYSSESGEDGFITNPPIVFASKTSSCSAQSSDFKTGDTVYICVQNAGAAPVYCHSVAGYSGCSQYITLSTTTGWSGSNGNWMKAFPVGGANGFQVGYSYTIYGMHTDDKSAVGQSTFSIYP